MSRRLIAEVVTGYRVTCTTDWPIVDQLHRCGPREWVVTRGLCNGVPDGASVYRTKREGLAALRGEQARAA